MTMRKAVEYREWAARVLADAQETSDPEPRRILLEIAQQLDRLAELVARDGS